MLISQGYLCFCAGTGVDRAPDTPCKGKVTDRTLCGTAGARLHDRQMPCVLKRDCRHFSSAKVSSMLCL